MKEWKGQVSEIQGTDFQGTMLWAFKLEESSRWFRCGKNQPEITEGLWITFTERNSNVDPASILVSGASTANVTRVTEREESKPSDVGKRIAYQAARRDATHIVVAALHTDHLPHAANVAKGKRLDLLMGYVQEITDTLLKQENDHE
jgi:hypothetical protein